MYSDDDEEGGVVGSGGGGQGAVRTRRVSEGNATGNSGRASSKPSPYSNSSNQGQSVNRHGTLTSSPANRERPKSLHPFEDKNTSIDQERRSISPTKALSIQQQQQSQQKQHQPQQQAPQQQQQQPNKPQAASTGMSTRKVQSSANLVKSNEMSATAGPQRSKSFVEQPHRKLSIKQELNTQDPAILATSQKAPIPPESLNVANNENVNNSQQKSDDDFDRMKEEADMLVAKLMADEESHKEETANVVPNPTSNHVPPMPATGQQEKWFYRDPQGEVQGPFLANEMAEWCKAGYFTAGLMVRRTCDERYATLGDLMKMCGGRVPFAPGPTIPPLKVSHSPYRDSEL